MRNPFERAGRRLIRRLGIPVVMVTGNGVTLPEIRGVFEDQEGETLIKGKGGGLRFVSSQPTLLVMTEDCPGLAKDWRILVKGAEYFSAQDPDDSDGCTLIYLAKARADLTEAEIVNNGNPWR